MPTEGLTQMGALTDLSRNRRKSGERNSLHTGKQVLDGQHEILFALFLPLQFIEEAKSPV